MGQMRRCIVATGKICVRFNEASVLKKISVLGSTGSIGRQTLAVVESMPDRFVVSALAAGNNLQELSEQISRHHPELVSVATSDRATDLASRLRSTGMTKL